MSYWKYLIFIFLIVLGCSAFGRKESDPPSTVNREKIDPSLLMEIEKLKSSQQMGQEISVLIRTKREIDVTERAAIEERGGKIGSVIGDIVIVRIPTRAVLEIADLDFVIYIEKSKKLQLR